MLLTKPKRKPAVRHDHTVVRRKCLSCKRSVPEDEFEDFVARYCNACLRKSSTPERWQHGDMWEEEHEGAKAGVFRRRVLTQTPLDRYYQREEITERQYVAGKRLYGLWRASGSESRITGAYEPPIQHAGELSDGQAYRRARFSEVMRHMGITHSSVLVWVCLCGESAKGWGGRTGIEYLRDALTCLADYWRL